MNDYGFYSKLLKKPFDTVEELETAEADYRKKHEAEIKAVEVKKGRAKEVNDAYKNYVEAGKKYDELLDNFIKDYDAFHMTYKESFKPMSLVEIIDKLFL